MRVREACCAVLAILLAAQPVWLAGCAHHTPPVSKEVRATLGKVAVISCGEAPEGGFYSPTSGKGAGSTKGSVAGIGACISAGALSGYGIGVVLGFLVSPVCALGGAVYGAVEAKPKAEVEASASAIDKAVAMTYLGNELRNRILEEAVVNTDYSVELADFDCPAGPDAQPDYRPLSASGVKTVLEIKVEEFGFKGRGAAIDPEIYLELVARARLVSTKDGAVLYEDTFNYASAKYTFGTWAQNDAAKLRRVIILACDGIAHDVVNEVFIAE